MCLLLVAFVLYYSGYLSDITGNYDTSFYVAGACILLAGLLYVTLSMSNNDSGGEKRFQEDDEKEEEKEEEREISF